MSADLATAARFERDRRASLAAGAIQSGGDAEAIAIDCQCWIAITEWLETDRFFSFAGGANPERDDAPIVRWPELELAAESALISVTALCDRLFAAEKVKAGSYEEACDRRSSLWAIHRKVQLRRESIDAINAEFRREEAAA